MKKLLLILCLILALTCLFVACDEGGDVTPAPDDAQNEENGETPEPEVHTHTWSAWETITAATCGAAGQQKSVCACGESKMQSIPATGGCVYNTQNICTVCNTALQYTEGLAYTLNSDGESYTVTKGTALNYTADIVIPWYHEEKPVTVIGYQAFYDTALTSIQIPASVTSIDEQAFYNCDSLTNVTFEANSQLTSIDESAFAYCYSLIGIAIPSSVTSIGSSAFYSCYNLIEVYDLSSGLDITAGSTDNGYVGCYAKNVYTATTGESKLFTENDYIFYDDGTNRYLMGYAGTVTELTLPASCNGYSYEIYQFAFYRRRDLTSITIPSGVTSIGTEAFESCDNLTSVTFGANSQLTSIGEQAFYWCDNLTSITIPASVTSIGNWAFCDCVSLTSITVPAGVTSIGYNAFERCTSLTSVTFENTTGWWVSTSSTATLGTAVDVSVPTNNDDLLKTTYVDYYWKRT